MQQKNNLRKCRLQLGLTLDEVAKAAGTNRQTIYKYESGLVRNIPAEKIILLARKLNVTPAYLIGWTSYDIALSDEEVTAIQQFRELDQAAQTRLHDFLNHELENMLAKKAELQETIE